MAWKKHFIWLLAALVLSVSIVRLPEGQCYNPDRGILSINGIVLNSTRHSVERLWKVDDAPWPEGYDQYYRGEWGSGRESVSVHYNENDRADSIVGYQLEQAGQVIAHYGQEKPEVFTSFGEPVQIDKRLVFDFAEGRVTVQFVTVGNDYEFGCHHRVVLTPEKARVGNIVLGELPQYLQEWRDELENLDRPQ